MHLSLSFWRIVALRAVAAFNGLTMNSLGHDTLRSCMQRKNYKNNSLVTIKYLHMMYAVELWFCGASYTREFIIKPLNAATALKATILHKTGQRSTFLWYHEIHHFSNFLIVSCVCYTTERISYLNISENIPQNSKSS